MSGEGARACNLDNQKGTGRPRVHVAGRSLNWASSQHRTRRRGVGRMSARTDLDLARLVLGALWYSKRQQAVLEIGLDAICLQFSAQKKAPPVFG